MSAVSCRWSPCTTRTNSTRCTRTPGLPAFASGLAGGTRTEILLTDCAGDPSRPLTSAQLHAKFMELTRDELGESAAQQLLGKVSRFTQLDDLGELMDLVAAPGPVPAEVGEPT